MISPEKMERYGDFIEIHSTDGIYDPKKGLAGFLSVLTPDLKLVVLNGMGSGQIYFDTHSLHSDTLGWLEGFGLKRGVFPLTSTASWQYCEKIYKEERISGSLVKIGSVVREIYEETPEGPKIGYMRSQAGLELMAPFIFNVCDFVFYAKRSNIPHRFDSMWRILGGVASSTNLRRPYTIFRVVDFLIKNPGKHTPADIYETFGDFIHNKEHLSNILIAFGETGIIDYQTPRREKKGKRGGLEVSYQIVHREKLEDIDQIYEQIRGERAYFRNRGDLSKIIELMLKAPDQVHTQNQIAETLQIGYNKVAGVLPVMANLGLVKRTSLIEDVSFFAQAKASANGLTEIFYDVILLPIEVTASTLNPLPLRSPDKDKLVIFLQNYQEERSQIGLKGGEVVREFILQSLNGSGEMKLSYLTGLYNQSMDRSLTHFAISHHLKVLIGQKLVKKTRGGFYSLTNT